MIPTADFIALLPLIGYFSFVVILHTFLPSPALRITTERTPRYALFLILAIISLGITWYHMLSFMKWSYVHYHEPSVPHLSISSLASWVRETHLFEQAWRIVCQTPRRWWWSSQLCTYTAGIWTVFLWEQCIFLRRIA